MYTLTISLSAHGTEALHWLAELVLLASHEPALLLLVEQFVALDVVEVAHVADVSEREVVVETSLASPVSNTLLCSHLFLLQAALLVAVHLIVFILDVFEYELSSLSRFFGCFLHFIFHLKSHVLGFTFLIFKVLAFLASKALLATLEVIVLALIAFPSTIWEGKVVLWLVLTLFSELLYDNFLRIESFLMEWSNTTSELSNLCEFSCLLSSWSEIDTIQRWEEHLAGLLLWLGLTEVVNNYVVHGFLLVRAVIKLAWSLIQTLEIIHTSLV